MAFKPMLQQQLIDLMSLLRVQQRIFLVFEVGMPIYPQQIYRSRNISLLPQHSQLQVTTTRRYFYPDCICKIEHFCDRAEGVIVLGDQQFKQPHVFASFRVEVQLSDEGQRLETQQQIDGRHCEFSRLPADQAAGGSVKGQSCSFCEVGGCGQFVEDLAHLLQDGSSVAPDLLIYMELGDLIETRPQLLIGIIQNNHLSYGDKFQRFSQQVFQCFEQVAAIRFSHNHYAKQRLPLSIFAALLFSKNHRFLNEDFSGLQFLDDFKNKTKAISAANPNINIDKIIDLMKARISSNHLRHVFDVVKLSNEVHELMNLIAEYKGKGEVEHYNEEQVKRIGSAFGEKLVLINYDEDKSALNQASLSHRNIYVLKAKEMYFILFKEQEIEMIEKGTVTHQELAVIFNVESKLEKSPQKPNPNSSVDPSSVVLSPTKSSNDLKKSSKAINQPSSSQILAKKGSDLTMSRIKHSILFPDQVTCTYCCKKVSQFSAIFWSYNYYCFQCVLSPKKDISFIPSSLIQKFLKGQKIQSREYLLICPECKSDTIIPNYRPWDKPKNYKCKACQKEICVEHEKMVGQCFCKCIECDKPTITIPTIFIKYCLNCKVRLCEICSLKSRKDCDCICPDCGQNKKVEHETCKPRCHSCFARDIPLMPCQCSKKLCPACYFSSLDPKAAVCVLK